MLEITEAIVIARQVSETLRGKRIEKVITNHSPHQFAWFYHNPEAMRQRTERARHRGRDRLRMYG